MSNLKFNTRITITRYAAPTQTAGGGLTKGSATTFTKYAAIENRSGSLNTDDKREWNYDYKITTRYTPNYCLERSSDLVTYESKKLVVREVVFQDEGAKKFVILRCSRHE